LIFSTMSKTAKFGKKSTRNFRGYHKKKNTNSESKDPT
jgi:hypothetical protein